MQRDAHKLRLRLPPGLRALIEEAADKEGRSVESEIVRRLEQSFIDSDEVVDFALEKIFAMVEKSLIARNNR